MRILLRFSCGFVAAALLVLTLLPGRSVLVLALLLLIPAVVLCVRFHGFGPVILGFAVGLIWTWGYQTLLTGPAESMTGRTVEITAAATDYSAPTAYGIRVPAVISDEGRSVRVMAWLYTKRELKPGDTFMATAELRAPEGENGNYYRAEGIHLLAYCKGTPEILPSEGVPIRYLPRWIAHRLEESLGRCVPEDALSYAVALTTGNRSGISAHQKNTLQRSGIYHMLALSGMHLSVLLGMITLMIRRKRLRALIGIPVSIAFAILTGAAPSIMRAGVMQCLILLAPLFGREEDMPTSLGAAALLLTAQNPWCLLGWGMQLSFASMTGIILLGDRLYQALIGIRRHKTRRRSWLRRSVCLSLAVTFSAMAFTTPLQMACYGRISLVSPLTNLLTGWMVGWCFRGSLLTALAGLISPAVGRVPGWCVGWCIRYVESVSGRMAQIPFAAISTGTVYGTGWVLLVYGILTLNLRTPVEIRRWIIPACCLLLGLTSGLFLTMEETRSFTMTALDVGQGQCLLFSNQGETVMVDCGGSAGAACGDLAWNYLSETGEDRVDVLILTHYDLDHTEGIAELLRCVPVGTILLPDMEPENENRIVVEQSARENGAELRYVSQTSRFRFGGGTVSVFPPMTETGSNSGLSLLVQTGREQILVTGDMTMEEERLLLDREPIPDVDILVAGHHGSKGSTSEALLEQARPEVALISVGRNRYGHPAPELLERLSKAGARIYRTDTCGTITLKGA